MIHVILIFHLGSVLSFVSDGCLENITVHRYFCFYVKNVLLLSFKVAIIASRCKENKCFEDFVLRIQIQVKNVNLKHNSIHR